MLSMHMGALRSRIAQLELKLSATEKQVMLQRNAFCSDAYTYRAGNMTTRHTIDVDGQLRNYIVHTPLHYDPSVRYPVILSFDGIDGSGSQMEEYSGLNSLPALVVYPDSLPGIQGFTAWQGAPYSLQGDYDIQFVRQLLDTLPSQYCADSANIFAVGMSNGGGFAVLAGCALSGQIKAIASVSGAYYTPCQNTKRQPSLLLIHGMRDQQVPFEGSTRKRLPKVLYWAEQQAKARHCRAATKVAKDASDTKDAATRRYVWYGCVNDSTVRLIVFRDQEHGWLMKPQKFRSASEKPQSVTRYIWEFFQGEAG